MTTKVSNDYILFNLQQQSGKYSCQSNNKIAGFTGTEYLLEGVNTRDKWIFPDWNQRTFPQMHFNSENHLYLKKD